MKQTKPLILLALLAWGSLTTAIASETNIITPVFSHLPSSPIVNTQTKLAADDLLSCKADSITDHSIFVDKNQTTKPDNLLPKSLQYSNAIVQATYNKMRNGVIRYVTKEVALSLFNFSVDGFAAENIASYVSDGTKPYLPFKFANGVKITKVTPKAGTIIYRAEMPHGLHWQERHQPKTLSVMIWKWLMIYWVAISLFSMTIMMLMESSLVHLLSIVNLTSHSLYFST